MTLEEIQNAKQLADDLELLKTIKKAQDRNMGIIIMSADIEEVEPMSDTLYEDLKEFVKNEIPKIEKEIEAL